MTKAMVHAMPITMSRGLKSPLAANCSKSKSPHLIPGFSISDTVALKTAGLVSKNHIPTNSRKLHPMIVKHTGIQKRRYMIFTTPSATLRHPIKIKTGMQRRKKEEFSKVLTGMGST
jgi:hypothetical protein